MFSFDIVFLAAVPPIVTVTPPTSDVLLEGMLVLSCDVRGEPRPGFSWATPQGARTVVDTNTRELTILTANEDHSGTYTCTATNPLGSAADSAVITVRGMY